MARPPVEILSRRVGGWRAMLSLALAGLSTGAAADDLPRGKSMRVELSLACSSASGAELQLTHRRLSYRIYVSEKGAVFDFDANSTDKGVRYELDGREHPMTKMSSLDGISVRSAGSALATWRDGALTLKESQAYRGPGRGGADLDNRTSDAVVYEIDLKAKRCAVREASLKRYLAKNGRVVQNSNCSRIESQTCLWEGGL